ncbi:16S rRNA (uracil(1498)-N(3))-methyltransferase [Asaia krungthepensis]|uniref:Ribosomal RNA small subunit methyltransferase E n=1 Tax=Asaia krungthepensis NRIC 0535 TaxID=1307925 RepID=A0ABQ0Q5B5_9PROT|nr:16S ribosomal RNA methyltransferase RsmE [Asaia krungthepensis NRIC 0535]
MQDAPRLHIDSLQPMMGEGAAIALDPGQMRYLATVLRLETGDSVHLFNAEAGEWEARLEIQRKDRGQAVLTRQHRAPVVTHGPVLVFAPLKRDATDLVLRMGTEMGVRRFCPVITERTNTHRINAERFHAIALEAAEQCERLDIPAIDPLRPLVQVLDEWDRARPLFAALERQQGTLVGNVPQDHALLIGPEGGFSETERRLLGAHEAVTPISLGNLILRADTAVVAGLAQLAFRVSRSI